MTISPNRNFIPEFMAEEWTKKAGKIHRDALVVGALPAIAVFALYLLQSGGMGLWNLIAVPAIGLTVWVVYVGMAYLKHLYDRRRLLSKFGF